MTVKLLGVQELDFSTREGDTIKGLKLHFSYLDLKVHGVKVDTKFISSAALDNLSLSSSDFFQAIGHDIDLNTDFNGKVYSVDF